MKSGDKASKNFVLEAQIKTIDDLVFELYNKKSIYWRHRVLPTSFFLGWPLRTILATIEGGFFWTIKIRKDQRA